MKSIKHAVILLNYQKVDDTITCINSIKKSVDAAHIIVVDNGSRAEVIAELKRAIPDLDLILAGTNLGFSAGNNLGIKKALELGAKVVYLLNNDTEVDPQLFVRAYHYVEDRDRIAGGKIYYAKGYEFHKGQQGRGDIIWYAGGDVDWNMAIAKHVGVDEIDRGQYDGNHPIGFISGCFMAIPRQVLERVGMLDEAYFLYLEDADYCLRASAHGVEVMYNSELVVYHRNSSSAVVGSPLVDYYLTRNRFFIARRYGTTRLYLALIREALFRNWNNPIRRMAFIDYLTNHMGNRNEAISRLTA